MTKILIAYGTTDGHTARIAEYLAEVVRGQAHEAPLGEVVGFSVPAAVGVAVTNASYWGSLGRWRRPRSSISQHQLGL